MFCEQAPKPTCSIAVKEELSLQNSLLFVSSSTEDVVGSDGLGGERSGYAPETYEEVSAMLMTVTQPLSRLLAASSRRWEIVKLLYQSANVSEAFVLSSHAQGDRQVAPYQH
jgi:hypothetical protein